jgi:hypothetical protein
MPEKPTQETEKREPSVLNRKPSRIKDNRGISPPKRNGGLNEHDSYWEPGVESSGRGRELVTWSLTSGATFIGEIREPTHNRGHVLDLAFPNAPFANMERRRHLKASSDHEILLRTVPGRGGRAA